MKLPLILVTITAALYFAPIVEAQPGMSTETEYLQPSPTPTTSARTVPKKPKAVATVKPTARAKPAAPAAPVVRMPPPPPVTPVMHINLKDFNDLVQFIAGMPVTSGTLATLEKQPEWIAYSNSMNSRWKKFDAGRLQPIRVWTDKELSHASTQRLFYPFSGPDFIYAETMFPNSSTYVLCGLEPVGDVPSLEKLQPLEATLGWLQASLKTLIDAGYFVTKDMNVELKMSPMQGTLPLMCVMLARSGARINSIARDATHVEIHFEAASGGHERTLYYFSADLSNAGMGGRSAFLNFLKQNHPDAAYVKSASYLMHEEEFSAVRNFLLTQCSTIVQDDSGIPLRYFDTRRWSLHLYGTYVAPLDIFAKYYQQDMADLYGKTTVEPLTFGAGYHWSSKTATLIVATAHAMTAPDKNAPVATPASRKHQ